MRTVSKDDEITVRGANPRTGVVTPWAVSEDSEDSGYASGYLGACHALANPRRRDISHGKWKQDVEGWRLVQSTTPIAAPWERGHDGLGNFSGKGAADKVMGNVSGVNGSGSLLKGEGQIVGCKANVKKALKSARGVAVQVKSGKLSSPVQGISHETCSQQLPKIRRKEVGSGPRRKEPTSKGIVIDQTGMYYIHNKLSVPPNDEINTGNARKTQGQIPAQYPPSTILPPHSRDEFPHCFTKHVGYPEDHESLQPSTYNSVKDQVPDSNQYQSRELKDPSKREPSTNTSPPLPPSISGPNLNQYLPSIRLLHPSSFTSLPGSYRRSVSLQPAHIVADQSSENAQEAGSAAKNEHAGKSTKQSHGKVRPRFQRQEGSKCVPGVGRGGYQQQGSIGTMPGHFYVDGAKRNDAIGKIPLSNRVRELLTSYSISNDLTERYAQPRGLMAGKPQDSETEIYTGWVSTGSASSDQIGSKCRPHRDEPASKRQNLLALPIHRCRNECVNRADDESSPIGEDLRRNTVEPCQRAYGDAGKHRRLCPQHEVLPREGESDGYSGASSVNLGQKDSPVAISQRVTPSLSRQINDRRELWQDIEDGLLFSSVPTHFLKVMAHHVTNTLHPSSQPLRVLRTPNTNVKEYLTAVKKVLLAVLYLLVLFNVLLLSIWTLRLFTRLVMSVLLPVRMAWKVVRWVAWL